MPSTNRTPRIISGSNALPFNRRHRFSAAKASSNTIVRYADFHALRHTFITNLACGDVHSAVTQALARHSAITLTMNRYTHIMHQQRAAGLAKLPDLLVRHATGTEGRA